MEPYTLRKDYCGHQLPEYSLGDYLKGSVSGKFAHSPENVASFIFWNETNKSKLHS
jgi:hypothetical protein